MKKIFGAFVALSLIASGAFFVSCKMSADNHTHDYDKTWSHDKTSHWYECSCGAKSDEAKHKFGEWSITVQPTIEAEGKEEIDCTVCHYHAEKSIAKLDHVHAKGTHHDAAIGNCVEKGTIDYYDCVKDGCVVKLDENGNPLSSVVEDLNPSLHRGTETTWTKTESTHKETYNCCGAVKTEESAHTWNDGEITKKPTKTEEGEKIYTCTVCEYTKTEIFGPIDYSTCIVGDIILKDGTICKVDDYDASTNSAAAVIVRAASKTKPALGVGLAQEIGAWCLKGADGYDCVINALVMLEDGSNGWEILTTYCRDAKNFPKYYPAWNFSLTYAENNSLTGDLADGWYLPTVFEHQSIYNNMDIINACLTKIGGETFKKDFYVTSTIPRSSYRDSTVLYNFKDGLGYEYNKNSNVYVCSVRVFN